MENFLYLKSQRGKKILVFRDYIYNIRDEDGDKQDFRCQKRVCPGRIIIENNLIIYNKEHDHESNKFKVEKLILTKRIKDFTRNTRESAADIILQTAINASRECREMLPERKYIRDYIRKERNQILEHVPKILTDIPETLKFDRFGNLFLRFDSGFSDQDRIIIFFSNFKENFFFKKVPHILVDGTFKIAPSSFYQVLVLHTELLGKTFPLIYVLLKNKNEKTYIQCFNKIKEITEINPKIFICDFEKGLSNAIKKVFHSSNIGYCFFHFSQSIWRRIQDEGLVSLYKNNNEFEFLIKKIISTAFLDVNKVFSFYGKLKSSLNFMNDSQISKFVQYLDYTYFGKMKDEMYENPIFEIKYWNIKNRVNNREPRTINGCESWHRCI